MVHAQYIDIKKKYKKQVCTIRKLEIHLQGFYYFLLHD